MDFKETQQAKLLEYTNLAKKMELEINELRTKFQELEQTKADIQKAHTEGSMKLNSYLQSAHVLETVLKDLELVAPVPVLAEESKSIRKIREPEKV